MSQALCSMYSESPTEATTSYYTDNLINYSTSEDITESINDNTLISNIQALVTYRKQMKQRTVNTKELPNEILLRIFDYLDDLKDILNLRCCSRKFKSLSEVKLYDIIEGKINNLEIKKKNLERRLTHMKNHLCPRLSHYKVFLNVISRNDVSELCNLPEPPKEVKYIFSVLFILYTGGQNCQCGQCIESRNYAAALAAAQEDANGDIVTPLCSNHFNNCCCGSSSKKITSRHSFSMGDLSSSKRNNTPFDSGDENDQDQEYSPNSASSSASSSRRNSFDDFSTMNLRGGRKYKDCELKSKTSKDTIHSTTNNKNKDTIEKLETIEEEEVEIPEWEEVRQIISKSDFRNWIMNLHSNLDVVPKEHILLANNLLNKPRDNLRLTYDRMLIVSQIGYKILLFIEAIIQSYFLTERFEEQKNNISKVYEEIHQWKSLQQQCKN